MKNLYYFIAWIIGIILIVILSAIFNISLNNTVYGIAFNYVLWGSLIFILFKVINNVKEKYPIVKILYFPIALLIISLIILSVLVINKVIVVG